MVQLVGLTIRHKSYNEYTNDKYTFVSVCSWRVLFFDISESGWGEGSPEVLYHRKVSVTMNSWIKLALGEI